jgi:hypothetical protein
MADYFLELPAEEARKYGADQPTRPTSTRRSSRQGNPDPRADHTIRARDTAQTLVCAVALMARYPDLARPPIAPWLIAQAEPEWRATLQFAIALIENATPWFETANGVNETTLPAFAAPQDFHNLFPLPRLPESLVSVLSTLAQRMAREAGDDRELPEETSWFITHFYEQFLAADDPGGRQQRGVYYTPRAVVRRMVADVEDCLESEFGLPLGFADQTLWHDLGFTATPHSSLPFLHLLDPAAGSGAFLVEVIERIAQRFPEAGHQKSTTPGDIRPTEPAWHRESSFDLYLADRLRQIRGFEILLPACLVAQLNVAAKLRQVGFRFTEPFPALVQPRDTLAGPKPAETASLFELPRPAPSKPLPPFTVVLGNPPFSGISSNDSRWMQRLLHGQVAGEGGRASYFHVDGEPLNEKKVWLNDDYVKFYRYAQWEIERAGAGLIAFVSNHGYLDNITFRGMRQSLLTSFSRVTIIDLHGNRKRHEMTLKGQPDHNLFGIAQGTAIGYFRNPTAAQGSANQPQFTQWDIIGTEAEKLCQLERPAWNLAAAAPSADCSPPSQPNHPFTPTERNLQPVGPLYAFSAPQRLESFALPPGVPLNELMPIGNSVPVTARDHLVIAFSADELENKLAMFANSEEDDESIRTRLFARARSRRYPAGDTRGWKLGEARKRLRDQQDWRSFFRTCLYRPWDPRVMFWANWMIDWPRTELMDIWCEPGNWGLITRRQMLPNQPCNFVWASDQLVLDGILRSDNRGNEYLFPIYRGQVAAANAPSRDRAANFSDDWVLKLSRQWNLKWQPVGNGDLETTWGPEDLGHYLYALLHSETYQVAYAHSLRGGFPPVVFPQQRSLLRTMIRWGKGLLDCHLRAGRSRALESSPVRDERNAWQVQPRFPRYDRGTVWTGPGEELAQVSEKVWEFRAGTHQVAKKWLADRRGRVLTGADQAAYEKVVAEIQETLDYQQKLKDSLRDARQFAEDFF